MLKLFKADLHIHTCLSPCADLGMTPSAIVKRAAETGIDIIAITDHNSAENAAAAKKAAEGKNITVLAGLEITTVEEAHILALFDDIESALKLQGLVYKNLLPGRNDEKRFGDQIVVNEREEVLAFNQRLLIAATSLSAQKLVNDIHSSGGLSIASHVDREAFSIISQLGFIPDDLKFDALEMSYRIDREKSGRLFGNYKSFAWVTSSDAHNVEDIGRRTTVFYINEPTIDEMRLALKRIEGRKVEWG